MYIVAIAWLFTTTLMAATEASLAAAVLTFLFYGLFPCALLVWIVGTPQRQRNRLAQITKQSLSQPDGANTKAD
jgi:glucan phosphoethanolaminetransferase (alkaline phosphatase superfamily)